MGKVFSIVELTAESGETTQFFASGTPRDKYDLMYLDKAKEFFGSIAQDQNTKVTIHTYAHGPGPDVPADNLDAISRNFERMSLLEMLLDRGERTITVNWARMFDDDFMEPYADSREEDEEPCET